MSAETTTETVGRRWMPSLPTTHPTIRKYERFIRPHVDGREVLDLGAVQHEASAAASDGWLHGLIAEDAAEVVGVDVVDKHVRALRADGWDIRVGDATDLDLGRTFETVVAGELVEHVLDVEGLLDSAARHLQFEGRLILTTPNAQSAYWTVMQAADGDGDWINDEHVCWYDATTLRQCLERTGWTVVDQHHAHAPRLRGIRSLPAAIGWAAAKVLPAHAAARNLVTVAERDKG